MEKRKDSSGLKRHFSPTDGCMQDILGLRVFEILWEEDGFVSVKCGTGILGRGGYIGITYSEWRDDRHNGVFFVVRVFIVVKKNILIVVES